jgi:hypothetical protein
MTAERTRLSCPSAQPDMQDARPFAVISGTAEAPRVAYLKESAVVGPEAFARLGSLNPTQVFRFAATCEAARCVHYTGQRCALAERIVEQLAPVVDALPPCLIRPTCRWYAEQGGEACRRCPQVVTMVSKADDPLNRGALPDVPPAHTVGSPADGPAAMPAQTGRVE